MTENKKSLADELAEKHGYPMCKAIERQMTATNEGVFNFEPYLTAMIDEAIERCALECELAGDGHASTEDAKCHAIDAKRIRALK